MLIIKKNHCIIKGRLYSNKLLMTRIPGPLKLFCQNLDMDKCIIVSMQSVVSNNDNLNLKIHFTHAVNLII